MAFRILSPETISVLRNFHSGWQKLPSGFCPWHSTNLPGEVTADPWVARSCGFLSVAGDTLSILLSILRPLVPSVTCMWSEGSVPGLSELLGPWRWVRCSFHPSRTDTQQRRQMHGPEGAMGVLPVVGQKPVWQAFSGCYGEGKAEDLERTYWINWGETCEV